MDSPRKRILVVDDEPVPRKLTMKALSGSYDVVGADSGPEALQVIEEGGVDLLITDNEMPGMNGVQLLERVRASHPDLPCLMISGHVEVARPWLEAHGIPYLSKPFRLAVLLDRVSSLLKP